MRIYYQAMLDWNDLRFVMETARNGGTSGAARVLGVNHATVARRITAAEEALGERLFDRLPSGYVPTEQPGFEAWIGRPFAHGTEHFELQLQLPVERG